MWAWSIAMISRFVTISMRLMVIIWFWVIWLFVMMRYSVRMDWWRRRCRYVWWSNWGLKFYLRDKKNTLDENPSDHVI